MPLVRLVFLVVLAMTAFAANSLLCRLALKNTAIDAATFTSVRLISGALVLWLMVRLRSRGWKVGGNWLSATALFVYAAAFSLAYVNMSAATGALVLFGAVQITMIGYGVAQGERLRVPRILGLVLAVGGLVGLTLPGLSAPPLYGSLLMATAGIAWGIYSLRGRGQSDPTSVTAGNFLRTIPMTAVLSLAFVSHFSLDGPGFWYAVASGALTSGIGYAVWYLALPALKSTQAATLQLSVPVIAAVGGILFLGEPLTVRLVLASAAILGGIALVISER